MNFHGCYSLECFYFTDLQKKEVLSKNNNKEEYTKSHWFNFDIFKVRWFVSPIFYDAAKHCAI